MNNRIREIRRDEGLTQTDFGARIGVKGNTITGYETGLRSPSNAIISAICKEFDCCEEWLRYGTGPKKPALSENEKIAKFMATVLRDDPDHIRKKVLSFISDLTEEDWIDLAKIASRHSKEKAEE